MEVPAAVVTMNVAKDDEAAGSGSPERSSAVVGDADTPMDRVSSVSSAPIVTVKRSQTYAGQGSPAVSQDTDYANVPARNEISRSDLLDAEDSQGGSRRSTRRRKYRNTKRSKKHTTKRKKTTKQSSKTRRSTKRKRNKKRRNTTRKN